MQKVVVDTCVLISGFVYGGIPAKAVELAFSKFQLSLSPKKILKFAVTQMMIWFWNAVWK